MTPMTPSWVDPTTTGTDLVELRSTVERRRFLCRTPCVASLPVGVHSIHFRTLGASLGTESIEATEEGARYRVRTASAGLYSLGQAALWVGAGMLLTGVTLLVQGQTSCPSTCSPWPGALVSGAGAVTLAVGIPLVVANARRAERLAHAGDLRSVNVAARGLPPAP